MNEFISKLARKELGGWMIQAHDHWKEFRPQMYQEYLEAGILERELEQAAQRTAEEMDQLMNAGYDYYRAWQTVRCTYMFLPEEEGLDDEDEDDDYARQLDLAVEIQADINEMYRKLASR